MAEIVGVFATSHVLFGSPDGDAQALRVVEGMNEIGRRVRLLRPDLLIVIGSDHLFNITTRLQPPFAVGVSDTFTPLGDMDIEQRPFAGNRAFAESLCARAADRFDLAQGEELRPDHGVMVPLMFIDPDGRIPVVPIYVNANMTPPPTAARAAQLGDIVAEAVGLDLPSHLRVVVVATGGLSHWINIPGHGEVNAEFDRRVIAAFQSGDMRWLRAIDTETLLKNAGNGGLEIVNWVMAAATLPGRRAEKIYYEPMPQWMTGMGGIAIV
uniref:CarBb n=1 Tax=Sphingomonas sp. XLDN2-5 TaxID=411925 RepID=D5IGG2_9SPHN|nr:CarBb [Sphingomonas sp. XLDN2-5]